MEAALAGERPPRKPSAAAGSLSWLIERYKDSAGWSRLSPATQSQRGNIFKAVCRSGGDAPYASITKTLIAAGRDRRRATPFAANDFLKAMRALFQWAVAAEFLACDPTDGVKGFGHKTEGFHVWTEDEIDRFEMRWPIGTRERLGFAILLYTGLRRGDAVVLGRQHIRAGVIMLRTEKNGAQITIPVLPALAEIIAASGPGDMALIATERGAPMTKESFGNWFRDACRAAGVPGTAHGLRKALATRGANGGMTEAELEAWFGWRGGHMASLYTRAANRLKLTRRAVGKLARAET